MPWIPDFMRDLFAAVNGSRAQVFAKYQEMTGYSRNQLYLIAKKNGWKSGRKARQDKGISRSLNEKQIDFIGSLLHVTSREVKGPIMPVERALEIAVDNGIVEPGTASVATVHRQLREAQASAAQLDEETPYTPMRSLHPNHVHEFDVSVCIQYYLKKGALRMMDERDFYKNKVDNYAKVKQRLMRYTLTDHFSGAFFFRYFYAGGESELNLLRFFLEAWGRKIDERYPIHGVPFVLLLDAGAANTAGMVKNLFKGLEIEIPKGMPHNPRRQGQAERTHNIIETNFESSLRIHPATSEDELNIWAMDWQIKHNAMKAHTRHHMTRTQCWLLIKPEQLRIMPPEEKCKELMTQPTFTREVNPDYTISYKGAAYGVKHIPGIRPRIAVEVTIKAFRETLEVKHQDKVYEVRMIEKLPAHMGGFRADAAIIGQGYKAQPETATQQAITRFENMAYGEDRKKDAIPFEGLKVHGIHADKIGNLAFIEKRGTAIEVGRSIADAEIPITELFKQLIHYGIRITKELNQQLRERYGESIKKSEAEEVITQIGDGTWVMGDGTKEAAAM